MQSRSWIRPALVAGLVVALAAPIAGAGAADHLDSPALGDTQTDINDLYVFEGADPDSTVLAMTVAPAAGIIADDEFSDRMEGTYQFRIDTDGDFVEDITYAVEFKVGKGRPLVIVREAFGADATEARPRGDAIAVGDRNATLSVEGGGQFFAGLRSDPFFFDLAAFQGTFGEAPTGRTFGDGMATDFFDGLNVLGIVLEVPDARLGGGPINVWATTAVQTGAGQNGWSQADRVGLPAINTVVNSTGTLIDAPDGNKELYNASKPKNDAQFAGAAIAALTTLSSLDTEGAFTQAEISTLAPFLLPDVLRFDKTSSLPAPLNGRALADDVIDTELTVVTGGDPLGIYGGTRDAFGAVNTDGVGPHDDYLDTFPYLGVPNS